MTNNKSIIHLPKYLDRSPTLRDNFGKIYSYERSKARLTGVPDVLKVQNIIRIINKFNYESTTFNEARANTQGVKNELSEQDKKYIENEDYNEFPFNDVKKNCPPSNIGINVTGGYCRTCENLNKYHENHDLVVFDKSNPLKFNLPQFNSYIRTAFNLLDETEKVRRKENPKNNNLFHKIIGWNALWRAGSSIPHGHLQTVLYTEGIPPMSIVKAVDSYLKYAEINYGRDIFRDIYRVHEQLELGVINGNTQIMASITPKKEKEIVMYTDIKEDELEAKESLIDSLYKSTRCLIDDLHSNSFNMSITQIPLKEQGLSGRSLYITRLVDRGPLVKIISDMGFMELLQQENIVATDPYKVIGKLEERI